MKKIFLPLIAGLTSASWLVVVQAETMMTVQIEHPYARAVAPGQTNSAAYMVLNNTGTKEEVLVGAESSVANKVELHTHRMEDGMMKMREIEKIVIPAGERVTLQPGGLHIMLIGLTHQLAPNEQVSLTLIYEDGERQVVTAPVHGLDDAGEAEYHHTMH